MGAKTQNNELGGLTPFLTPFSNDTRGSRHISEKFGRLYNLCRAPK